MVSANSEADMLPGMLYDPEVFCLAFETNSPLS